MITKKSDYYPSLFFNTFILISISLFFSSYYFPDFNNSQVIESLKNMPLPIDFDEWYRNYTTIYNWIVWVRFTLQDIAIAIFISVIICYYYLFYRSKDSKTISSALTVTIIQTFIQLFIVHLNFIRLVYPSWSEAIILIYIKILSWSVIFWVISIIFYNILEFLNEKKRNNKYLFLLSVILAYYICNAFFPYYTNKIYIVPIFLGFILSIYKILFIQKLGNTK